MLGLVPGMTIHRARRWRSGKTAPKSEHNKKRLSPEQIEERDNARFDEAWRKFTEGDVSHLLKLLIKKLDRADYTRRINRLNGL